MIIRATDTFDLQDMQTDLLIKGCYVFHDSDLEDICNNITSWIQTQPNFYCAIDDQLLQRLHRRIQQHTQGYLKLNYISGNIGQGIDQDTDQWHDDANEHMDIQFLCYQSTLTPQDGGALEMQCFDGINRQYYPCAGDILVMNHRNLLVHRVQPLVTDKPRVVCNVYYRYAE